MQNAEIGHGMDLGCGQRSPWFLSFIHDREIIYELPIIIVDVFNIVMRSAVAIEIDFPVYSPLIVKNEARDLI